MKWYNVIRFFRAKREYMENVEVELCFKHENNVDLVEMANALIALQNLTAHQIGKNDGVRDTKILLKGVRSGSDIFSLVIEFAKDALPVIEGVVAVVATYDIIKRFAVIKDEKVENIIEDKNMTPQIAGIARSIVAPIEDNNSSMIFTFNGDNTTFIIDSEMAKDIRHGADIVDKLKGDTKKDEKENRTCYQKVLIAMHKTTNTDKAVKHHSYCDDIVKGKSVATIIENSEDSKVILSDPYTNYFLVDIEVNKVGNDIKLFRVTCLHEVIPIEL